MKQPVDKRSHGIGRVGNLGDLGKLGKVGKVGLLMLLGGLGSLSVGSACSQTEPRGPAGAASGGAASGGGSGSHSGGLSGAGGAVGTGGVASGGAATGGGAAMASGGNNSGVSGRGGGGLASVSGGQVGSAGDGGSAGGMGGAVGGAVGGAAVPSRSSVIGALTLANNYFMTKWPDPGVNIDASHPSNIWTRAVYFEGLMALHAVDPQPRYYDYAVQWGASHAWGINGGTATLSADNQCAGQTYIDLYNIDRQGVRIRDIETTMSRTLALTDMTDWSWVDAIQMAMPVFAKLGVLRGNNAYFAKMYGLYSYTKNNFGAAGLYSKTEHLWWRDADFDPPYKEPNGQDCYWSRGNGWVYAALARVLDTIPTTESHRAEYLADFVAMSEALRVVQRSDGFWNVSLHDPTNFGGKETTGTALFTYGMAMGVRKGWLGQDLYRPVAVKGWNAMVTEALHPNGFLGWVQGTGKQPSDGQPVTYDKVPNYDDFGVGCFLLAGSEVSKLAPP